MKNLNFDQYFPYVTYPSGWTYPKESDKIRPILLRGCREQIGRVVKEMNDKGVVSYRIDGTPHTYKLLNTAGHVIYANYRINGGRKL